MTPLINTNVLITVININFELKLKFTEKMSFLKQNASQRSICEELNFRI
jgi:hypothetical protein